MRLTVNHHIRMFVLIWVTLLFPATGSNADAGATLSGRALCQNGFCITLNDGEITAEAGLCVVIPCTFTPGFGFSPLRMVWFKCEPLKEKCGDSDMIFHTDKNNRKIKSRFKGRVSLLEPDVIQRNCSIIINDLTESDSGSYQLRVNGVMFGSPEGFTFSPRTTVSVKDLIQKPTVRIPPLSEGQQTTLTCTAPGLCSGSEPEITWTWRGTGGNNFHNIHDITAFNTETLTPVTQRHSSTLTLTPSVMHHGTKVSCKVSFINGIAAEETVTLNVTWFPEILNNSGCEVQSELLTCVCISKGFPLPTIKWPLLKNHTEYSVITRVSNHTVHSTFTLTVKDHSSAVTECVSSSDVGEVRQNITIVTSEKQEGPAQPCGPHSAVLPWAIAAVSLIVNVICIICLMILWNTKKKMKPSQEDRTYMSLQQTDRSPQYDVIGQPLN